MAIVWQPEATTTRSKAMNCLLHNHYINGDTGTYGKQQKIKNSRYTSKGQGVQE